ncbi:MAG: nucleotidyltransferase family protein [Lachnospiraceae bacterium]|nr:nucleotidyltransferase family protein [Lachnospiraceae bacterium]
MKIAGVIAEFDPFHNGHAYFLRRVRELTSADFIIAVMSGDFTQRGNIAVCDKKIRAEAALQNGADAVIELPVRYATASAELFAHGGTALLEALGCVDVLCFGTEDSDIGALKQLAVILSEESGEYKASLEKHLKEGKNYPSARLEALKETAAASDAGGSDASGIPGGRITGEQIDQSLCQPNNILALEYLKSLIRLDSDMDIVNIKREATDHDSVNTYGIYSSAKNIRTILRKTGSLDAVSLYLPENTLPLLREAFGTGFPVFDDDLSSLMNYRLLSESEASLMRYADMSRDLARRIMKKRDEFVGVSQFTELIKTRNLTYTRISRALLHMLLGVEKEAEAKQAAETRQEAETKQAAETDRMAGYARILGFRKDASELVKKINETATIPVLSRVSDRAAITDPKAQRDFEEDLRASGIYGIILKDLYGTEITPETRSVVTSGDGVVMI